ncbi:MAG: protein-export chaperone SecB [Alphaproteobacteria bacterium]|nr:protein-export chaperone SecB [Alphaproteobacteria bacterium]
MTDSSGAPQEGPSFGVLAQYLKDLSFESPRAPDIFLAQDKNPQVGADVRVEARPLGENVYEVELSIQASARSGEETVFVVDCLYAGVFQIAGLPQEHLGPFLMIECPRMIFPFARNIVADATREGGFPPLLLQPVDFVELYRKRLAEQTQAPTPSATGPSSRIILPS